MSAFRTISSTVGKHLQITVFGGPHEPSIGVRLEGLPEGFRAADIDMAQLQAFLARRAPGSTPYGTARKEADAPVLTAEDPLTFEIYNKDQHSGDYKGLMNTPRPGHADYTAGLRYHGEINMAGGGPFSGRMTAPLCIAGDIALQILAKKGIQVHAQLVEAGGVASANAMLTAGETNASYVPPEDDPMYQRILAAKADGDSVGGLVRCTVSGMPGGIGGAMYDGLESLLSPIVFGIPGVKGVSFGDGFAVCARAKERGIPVIFLTASGEENSVVRGLDLGADDYIAKPFRPRELVSRIKNILRLTGSTGTVAQLGDVLVDTVKGTATKNGKDLFLSALEYRLLLVFINNRGAVMTRTKLLESIWDIAGEFVNDNTLTVYIKRLREKIEDDPQNPTIIKTVRGMGYRVDL
jgi:DNA-binding response OmpR family regulator